MEDIKYDSGINEWDQLSLNNDANHYRGHSQVPDRPVKSVKNYKIYVYFDKMLSGVVKCMQFVVKLILLQISLILPEFTYFIFTSINTHINMDITFTIKHTNFIKINTNLVAGPKCSPSLQLLYFLFLLSSFFPFFQLTFW